MIVKNILDIGLLAFLFVLGFLSPVLTAGADFVERKLACPFGSEVFGSQPPHGNLMYCGRLYPNSNTPTRHGPYITWHSNGNVKSEGRYEHGKFDGMQTKYFMTGKVREKKSFANGVKDGEHVEYFENGSIRLKESFKMGKIDGHKEKYFENGDAYSDLNYKEGDLEGPFILFYDNGNRKAQGFYHNRQRTGTWTTFYANGQKKRTGRFTQGQLDGEWNRYGMNGVLLETTKYERGNILKHYRLLSAEDERKAMRDKKIASIDDKHRAEFKEWNSGIRKQLKEQKKRRVHEYIPRDEKSRIAWEKLQEKKEAARASKALGKQRRIERMIDENKSPVNGLFDVKRLREKSRMEKMGQ